MAITVNTLALYMGEVGGFPQLKPGEDAGADFTDLVTRNLRLVVSIAKRYVNEHMDLQECIQEGNVGLIKAANRYDPARGQFASYATFIIKSEIQQARRVQARRGYTLMSTFDEICNDIVCPEPGPEGAVRLAGAVEHMRKRLTPKQQKVVWLRFEGYGLAELGKAMDISHQAVRCLEQNGLKKLCIPA